MDNNDSPAARVERTFWTVWYYITGAVNRFFQPEPTNIISNDPNPLQESTADSEPANCGHAEGDRSGGGVDEEHPLATASLISSSQPLVAWEHCTTEIDLRPDEEGVQHKTQLGSGNTASEEGEGMREEQSAQTGGDDARPLVDKDAKTDEQEESRGRELCACGQNEMPKSVEYEEGLNTSSQRLAGDAMSEDMEESGRRASAENETEGAMTPDDLKEMDETAAKVQVVEEDDKMHREDKRDVETKDTGVKSCTITDLILEEEDNKRAEEERVQTADLAVMHEEVENGDSVLLLASENENKSVEEARQVENQFSAAEELPGDNRDLKGDQDFDSLHELQMSHNKIVSVFKDEPVVAVQEHVTAHGSESDKDEDLKDQEGERTLDEREQDADIEEEDGNEATNNQTIDEELQLEDTKTVAEDSQEEDVLNGHAVCSEEAAQAAARTWHAVEFRDGEQEDVAKDTKVETKRRDADDVETESTVIDKKYDVMTTHISGDEAEEERLSSEVDNEEGYMEVACPATSVTVKSQGETGQEISGEFKNVSTGTCEGQLVVSRELNSPTCEETQEGVPEYNNEPGEPDENTTQRFLEVGDCEEIPTTQLPEEVENKDPESLQNSGCSTGAYLFVRERMEEEQDSTDHIQHSFSLVVEEHAGIGHLTRPAQVTEKPLATVIEESEFLLKEEEGKLLSDSMKTGFEDSEKEFETHTGLADEAAKATKEQQDETQELLVEFEKDEEFCDSKEADATRDSREATGNEAQEVQKMTETSFLQELVDTIQSEQNNNRTPSLVDISEFGLKQLDDTEPILLEKGAVEMQDAGIDMEETGYGVEEEAETQIKNEMELVNLQVVATAAELTTENNEKENTLIAEVSETLKTETLLSGEALETSDEEMFTETEAADGSMTTESRLECLTVISTEETTKHVTESEGSNAEETVGSISGHQDVIDEDILDWWIQTASSEDADGMKQQEGLEQQMDTEIESSSEEQHDLSAVQTEKDKEQTVEANSGESEVVIDTEISSSTAESGFSDQSLSEWGTQNSEAQQLKSTSTGSPQGIYDMPADMSESTDISEVSKQQPNSGLQDILMEESYLKEEESITETGFPPYSGAVTSEVRHLNQESDRSLEKTDEDTGPQLTDLTGKSDKNDAEQADVTGTSTSFKVEETEVENEPFEITAPEAARSRSSSEVSSEGRGASTESNSDGNTCTESERRSPSLDKPQPEWSEDVAESLPGPHAAEVAEQLAAISEDEMEVDASALDFTAQRSRIAVKNPRVRPPKDPRSLLHMPSLDPTPSTQTPAKVPAGVPLGGLGIGIKLPGLGAGFPVLKKTPRAVRDENSQENVSREPETKPEEKSDTPKQDEAQHKPKWMPPRHPGFGNPLMSELKTKLKKTTKE